MTLLDITEIVLLFVLVFSMLLTVELEHLYQVAIAFIAFMTALSAIYWIYGAPLLALFQLSIYAGTTGVILFAVIGVFPQEEIKEEVERDEVQT